jgi:murein DD-endopeptidase MepM/ murein hydrolase activator NlpD
MRFRVRALTCVLSLMPLVGACQQAGSDPPRVPAGTDIYLERQVERFTGRVPANATLASLLASHGIGGDMALRIVTATATRFDPRRLRHGQPYELVTTLDGLFREFTYEIDRDQVLQVAGTTEGESPGLQAEILPVPRQRVLATLAGGIDAGSPSLVSAMNDAGEGVDLALALADIFSGQVNFNADLRVGDAFKALFEKDVREGQPSGYGSILAAEFTNDGRRLQAFRFVLEDGRAGYFDEDARSVRRLLLPSPLPFDPRITSRFTTRRMHPILGVTQPHLGVDFAAPMGTPVVAVADGIVISTSAGGASGRMVRLRHANGYQSYYLHLSAFAPGLRSGTRVAQGQVIGKVGRDGLATGPHLDYRLSRNGVFVDPIRERRNLPAGDPVPANLLASFNATRDEARQRLSNGVSTDTGRTEDRPD